MQLHGILLVSGNLYYKVDDAHPRAHLPVKACIFIILMHALVCEGSYRVPSAGDIYPCR